MLAATEVIAIRRRRRTLPSLETTGDQGVDVGRQVPTRALEQVRHVPLVHRRLLRVPGRAHAGFRFFTAPGDRSRRSAVSATDRSSR